MNSSELITRLDSNCILFVKITDFCKIEEEKQRAESEKMKQIAEINRLKLAINDITKEKGQSKQIAEVRVIHQEKKRKVLPESSGWFLRSWLSLVFQGEGEPLTSPNKLEAFDSSLTTAILKV